MIAKLLSIILLIFGLLSCVDLDDYTPTNSVPTEGAIHDLATAEAALTGLYDALQDDAIVSSFNRLAQIYSDEAITTGSLSGVNGLQVCGPQEYSFLAFYTTINYANNIIELLPGVIDPTFSDEIRNNMMAETLFIRSLCYFLLTNAFDNVPLVLTPTINVDESLEVSNTLQEDIYDQITNDLLDSKEDLLGSDTKRVTKDAANSLLARISLYRGHNDQALSFAEEVVGNGFDLAAEYPDYLTDQLFFLEFSVEDGNNLGRDYGEGGIVVPTVEIIAAFENGDLRTDLSIANPFPDSIPAYVVKYPDFQFLGFGSDPLMLFRHAEVVLIAAEAAAATGDFPKANGYFNQVRRRAGLQELTLDENNYVDIILQERFVELCFEGPHRWWDLRRLEKAEDFIDGYESCKDFWPIPQEELDKNNNLNQNSSGLDCPC